MAALASGDWIRQAHNLCITGPTGCGKTWLACALGNQACRQGLSVRYLRLPALFEHLRIAHGDGSWPMPFSIGYSTVRTASSCVASRCASSPSS